MPHTIPHVTKPTAKPTAQPSARSARNVRMLSKTEWPNVAAQWRAGLDAAIAN